MPVTPVTAISSTHPNTVHIWIQWIRWNPHWSSDVLICTFSKIVFNFFSVGIFRLPYFLSSCLKKARDSVYSASNCDKKRLFTVLFGANYTSKSEDKEVDLKWTPSLGLLPSSTTISIHEAVLNVGILLVVIYNMIKFHAGILWSNSTSTIKNWCPVMLISRGFISRRTEIFVFR